MPNQFFSFISRLSLVLAAVVFGLMSSTTSSAQQPTIIQPGAPGEPSKTLPSDTRAKLVPIAAKDIEFMQGMIHHHAQAVEMTALIADRTQNKELRLLGARISQSQSDEMNFMKRWLRVRGQSISMPGMPDPDRANHHTGHHTDAAQKPHEMLMPGMLTKAQMEALRNSKGADFDNRFLDGMIQHHTGALVMVKELFDSAGSGQDAELFNFASDVDSGQRSEIRIMETMRAKNP